MCGTGLCADTQSVAPFVHNKQLWYVASQSESKYNTPTSDHIFPSRLQSGSRSWGCLWGGAGHESRKRVSIEQCKVQRTVLVVEICELCMWRMYGCSIILLGHRWQHQKNTGSAAYLFGAVVSALD